MMWTCVFENSTNVVDLLQWLHSKIPTVANSEFRVYVKTNIRKIRKIMGYPLIKIWFLHASSPTNNSAIQGL